MRMKVTKVLLSLMVALVCICNVSVTVLAASNCVMTKEELLEKYSVDTGNTQADELFNNFVEKLSALTVEEYSYYFDYYVQTLGYYQERFITYCNGTEEEWQSKDTIEQYLWNVLYIEPLAALAKYSWDEVMGEYGYIQKNIMDSTYDTYSQIDGEFGKAYLALMEWQYNYIYENSAVYNFMTGEDSLGNTKIGEIDMGEQQKTEESKEVSEPVEESKEETPVTEKTEEEGIWDDTKESVKSHSLTFVILGVLVVALVGVIIYRKSKGIDDDKVA